MNNESPKTILIPDNDNEIALSPLEYEIINFIIGKVNNKLDDILTIPLEDEGVLDMSHINSSIHGIIEKFIVSRYLEFIFGCKLIPIEVVSLNNGDFVVRCRVDNKKSEIPLVLYTHMDAFIQKKKEIQGEAYDGEDVIIAHYYKEDIKQLQKILEHAYEKKYSKLAITRESVYAILRQIPGNDIDIFDIGFEVPSKKEYPSQRLMMLYEQMSEIAAKQLKTKKGKR